MAQSRADQSRPTVTWTKLTEFTGVTSKSVRRLARFACVGLIGVGVNNTLLWLLTERAHVYYLLSSALATEVAILSNFTLNYVWTFAALRDAEPVLAKLAKFNQVALGGLLLTVSVLFVLTHFFGLHYLIANLLAVGSGAAWNYTISRHWVWPAADPPQVPRSPADSRHYVN